MPIIKKLNFDLHTNLALWKIEESEERLMSLTNLPPTEKLKLELKKNKRHRLGFLSSRASLEALDINLNSLQFNRNGMPYLSLEKKCSISHTFEYATVVVSSQEVGVDVEMYRPKIVNIASKFVHPEEYFVKKDTHKIELLTRLWTAKEAVYKAFSIQGLSFSKQIKIAPFSLADTRGVATVDYLGSVYFFYLYYTTLNQSQLCLAIKK